MIRKSISSDVSIAAHLCEEDLYEQHILGYDPGAEIRHMLGLCGKTWTWEKNGQPMMIFGANSPGMLDNCGWVWLCMRTEAKNHLVTMLRNWRPYLAEMEAAYDRLETTIAASLKSTVRWIKWAGFTVEDAVPMGVNGELFHYCWKECR